MKSLRRFIAVLFVSSVSFMAFAAAPKVNYAALSEEYTPENSVVMIFMQQNDFEMYQINPDFDQNQISIKQSEGCTTPMQPDSTYLILMNSVAGNTNWYGTPSIVGSLPLPYLNYTGSTFKSGYKLTIPSKPGLYIQYFGLEGNDDSMNATKEDYKKSTIARNFILSRLKKSAKLYAGTAWEALINEEMEEWKK